MSLLEPAALCGLCLCIVLGVLAHLLDCKLCAKLCVYVFDIFMHVCCFVLHTRTFIFYAFIPMLYDTYMLDILQVFG